MYFKNVLWSTKKEQIFELKENIVGCLKTTIKHGASTSIWKFVKIFYTTAHSHELVWFANRYPKSNKNVITLTHSTPKAATGVKITSTYMKYKCKQEGRTF